MIPVPILGRHSHNRGRHCVFRHRGRRRHRVDDTTGKLLWKFPTDGRPYANPMSYLSEGKQQIAICIGHAVYAFGL